MCAYVLQKGGFGGNSQLWGPDRMGKGLKKVPGPPDPFFPVGIADVGSLVK